MYMSRVTIRIDGTELADVARMMSGGGYRAHQALWHLFHEDSDAERDFLYRQENGRGLPSFLVVSKRLPVNREGLWQVESKEYRPQLKRGQRLGFSVRVNPVVSRRDELGRQHRHDVVMDLKRRLRKEGKDANQTELVQQAIWQWQEGRFANLGFTVEPGSLMAEGYRQYELRKQAGQKIRFSTVDCSGLLTVTDPERLSEALYHGIGPAKAFGCGLLLIRRL